MINSISSAAARTPDICAPRQNRTKQADSAQETVVESDKKTKSAHPAHPHGHVPPGLERAAENIASKIFARADADGSGTVTQEELSALHSRHARALASSDLFKVSTDTSVETSADTTAPGTDGATTAADPTTDVAEPTPPAPTSTAVGVTESQLKEALAKFFYAKIGVRWTPSQPPATEPSDPTQRSVSPESTDSTKSSVLTEPNTPPTPADPSVTPATDVTGAAVQEAPSEPTFAALA